MHAHVLYFSVKFEFYAKRVQRVQPILYIPTLSKNTAVAPFGCTLGKKLINPKIIYNKPKIISN